MNSIRQENNDRIPFANRLIPFLFLPLLLLTSSLSKEIPETSSILDGIDILFDTEPRMFPPSWYCKRIGAEAVSLPKEYRTEAMDILNHAIAKYPEEVLFVYLRKVYVLKSLAFFGVPYGGTNTKDVIYLTYDNSNPERTSEFVEGVFHHEFSSVLLRKFTKNLDKKAWESINPPDFFYGKGGVEAIKKGEASLDYDYSLLEIGFLNKYSQSDFEEDVNVVAQNLFCGGEQFWFIVDTFGKIREKTTLAIHFYHQIDPQFTEEYFRTLAYSQ
ncbi:MAG: hypothetical protein JXA23_03005 [Bacteroidales bacterium]|nr:hypothetical protein [Bacteroidales bacterium]